MLAAVDGVENLEAAMDLVPSPAHTQQRCLLRGTWQLASVLHFLNVFRSVLDLNLKFSMEELETALLVPNTLLDDIHICLLKAIPPNSRNPINQETWVAVLCKKLKDWWHVVGYLDPCLSDAVTAFKVAEGPFPLIAQRGDEVRTYKDLSPDVRVIILKALCETRLDQEDVRAFISEMAKQETSFLNIRKERTGTDKEGATYWYENDPIAGQRLYRELQKFDTDKAKVRGHLVPPPATSEWETLATNLDEFQTVVDKLCSSRNKLEVGLGKKINIDILPDLINAEKRKQRMLKKQLRQAALLDNNFVAVSRSRRERKPVSYTFDDYDNSINEALEVMTVMENSNLSDGSARRDTDEDMDETTGTRAKLRAKSEATETAMPSSKSDSFSSGSNSRSGGLNRGSWKAIKSDSSDATHGNADASSGNDSEGEADCLRNKRRRVASSSGADDSRSKKMEDSEGLGDYDVKEESMELDGEGKRNPTVYKRKGQLQANEEPQESLAKMSSGTRGEADCIKQENYVDSDRSERAEFVEIMSSACSREKTSAAEELGAGGCKLLGKSKVDNEEGDKKDGTGRKMHLRTAKREPLHDCRRGRKMHMLLDSNATGPVGV